MRQNTGHAQKAGELAVEAKPDDQGRHQQGREGAAEEKDLAERQLVADQLHQRVVDEEDEVANDDRGDADQVLAKRHGGGGGVHEGIGLAGP